MKTIKSRIEDLEKRHENKPIMVLWGDWNDENLCRVGEDVFTWAEAKKRFENEHYLIFVQYVDDWRANDY